MSFTELTFDTIEEAIGAEIIIQNTADAAMKSRVINEYGLFRRETSVFCRLPQSIINIALNHPDMIYFKGAIGSRELMVKDLEQVESQFDSTPPEQRGDIVNGLVYSIVQRLANVAGKDAIQQILNQI